MTRCNGKTSLALSAAGLAALALALSGCGRMGPLEQPAPLFGERAKQKYQEQKAAEARAAESHTDTHKASEPARAADQPDEDNTPKTKRDIKAPEQKLTPLSQTPIDGAPNLGGKPVSVAPPN